MKPQHEGDGPQQTALTYEKLITYKGFEHITQAEAEDHIQLITCLAKILFLLYRAEHQKENDQKKPL